MKNNRHSKLKKIIKSRLGMTYVELLTALALLSLIVVSFTPMLLSSYETLYDAGERTEAVYNSQKEIEGGLAARTSINQYSMDLRLDLNGSALMEQLSVTGRRIVSSMNVGLETIFYGSRVRVDIVSPKVVYDNKTSHEVTLQITGIPINKDKIKLNEEPNLNTPDAFDKEQINICVYFPNKQNTSSGDTYTNTDEEVYTGSLASATNMEIKTGDRITFTIRGSSDAQVIDFTNSPMKIKVFYKNDRGLIRTVSDYLYIKPAQMLFAGTTNNYDYYTSAGVEEEIEQFDDKTQATAQNTFITLDYQGRSMSLDNSLTFNPSDSPRSKTYAANASTSTASIDKIPTTINTVEWVDNDPNPYLDGYYVLAGTNGSVYRMYNYKKPGKQLNEILSANLIDAEGNASYDVTYDGSYYTATNYNATNFQKGTSDYQYKMDNGAMALQSFWGGEVSDQYYFRTSHDAMGYGNAADNKTDCTEKTGNNRKRGTTYDAYDKTLRYIMNFSGNTTGYSKRTQANRRISYILTEMGQKSARTGGEKSSASDFIGYTTQWEWGRYTTNDSSNNDDDWEAIYFANSGDNQGSFDYNLSYLRLKSYTSVDVFTLVRSTSAFKDDFDKGGFWSDKKDTEKRDDSNWDYTAEKLEDGTTGESWITSKYANSPNITAAVYLPSVGSQGQGQMMYFGYVPAYAYLQQRSDIKEEKAEDGGWFSDDIYTPQTIYRSAKNAKSAVTDYLIGGSYDDGTQILRAYGHDTNNSAWVASQLMAAAYNTKISDRSYGGTYSKKATTITDENYFYTNKDSIEDTEDTKHLYRFVDSDLKFTFGYCSRWRTTMGTVTSDGIKEYSTSYEYYYVKSSEGVDMDTSNNSAQSRKNAAEINKPTYTQWPNNSGADTSKFLENLNKGGESNIFYNVWFPGEMYNLTKVATYDEVTVAVGYTVSGGAFMKESERSAGFYGTALGDIYNDGVLAAYISEDAGGIVYTDDKDLADSDSEQYKYAKDLNGNRNTIFQNLLYCKSTGFEDATRHSRQHMRFEAVGLNAEMPEFKNGDASTYDKSYIAYYADNYGKVYKSKIATSTVEPNKTSNTDGATSDDEATGTESGVTLVNYIEDQQGFEKRGGAGEKMFEITVNGSSVSSYFSQVTTIDCEDDIIIITGTPATNQPIGFIVGVKTDADRQNANDPCIYEWTWKFVPVQNADKSSAPFKQIYDATTVSGYYYICGTHNNASQGGKKGFVGAVSLDTLKTAQGIVIPSVNTSGEKDKNMLVVYTEDEIRAIAGRETN